MKLPTVEQQNEEAKNKRKNKIAALKGLTRAQEGQTHESLEEKLFLSDANPTRDDDIDYNGFRLMKKANAEFKLEASISQQQQEQEQEQEQQQQQQQQQVTQTQQVRDPAKLEFEVYKGYKNLVSVQKFDHGKKTDTKELSKLYEKYYPGLSFEKLKYFSGIHDSQYGGIGYLTLAAIEKICETESLSQFYSGVFFDLDNPDEDTLPDGFRLFITEGERHMALSSKDGDKREYPRLVLDFKEEYITQKKHPFKLQLLTPPEGCKVEGTPAQFNMSGGKEVFSWFARRKDSILKPDMKKLETKKLSLQNIARKNIEGFFLYANLMDSLTLYAMSVESMRTDLKAVRDNRKISSQCEMLFNFMRGDNKTLANQLIVKHNDIFTVSNHSDIAGYWEILYCSGCEGMEIFLSKMQKIFDVDNGDTYFHLKYSFLFESPNWEEFLENKTLEAFDKIIGLTATQRLWWNALSYRHIQNCGWSDFCDLFSAFEFFWNEYRKIGIEKLGKDHFIELAAQFNLGNTGNMKVVLPRVLTVMKNSRNFKEQAEYLRDIDFNSNDVYYASQHQKYSLIASNMMIDTFKSNEAERKMKENQMPDSDIRVTFEEMIKQLDNNSIVSSYLYKYIGIVPYSAPYQDYIQLVSDFFYSYKKPFYYLRTWQSNRLIFIISVATTHQRGYQCSIKDEVPKLYPFLDSMFSTKTESVITHLLDLIIEARWLNLSEVIVVAKIFFNVSDEQKEFLSDMLIEHKEEFMRHVSIYDQYKNTLDANTYICCIYMLNEEKSDEHLVVKLPRIFSLITDRNFKLDHIKKFTDGLKEFQKKQGRHAYNQLVDILSILKLQDETQPRPTMADFLQSVRSYDEPGDLSVKQFIASGLPKNCTYNPAECRSVIIPPLGTAKVVTAYLKEARAVGIYIDAKRLDSPDILSEMVRISKLSDYLNWKDTTKQFIVRLQKEQLSEHEGKITLDSDNDKRLLNEIIHVTFLPGKFADIEDSLAPMENYCHQIAAFIDALKLIKDKWPDDLAEVLVKICGDPAEKRKRSIKFLNDFLCQVEKTFTKKMPFPHDFFTMLIEHEKMYGITYELLAIDVIFAAKGVSRHHKMDLLKLNLDSAAVFANAGPFIRDLVGYHAKFSAVFSCIFQIIEKIKYQRETVFRGTLSVLELLEYIDDEKFTEHLFSLFARHPEHYLEIVKSISNIPVPEVIIITKKPEEETKELPIPTEIEEQKESPSERKREVPEEVVEYKEREVTEREMITRLIFQCCDPGEFNAEDITSALKKLQCEHRDTLVALLKMRPAPTFKTLKIVLANYSCQAFLKDSTNPEFGYRLLARQFDTSRVLSAINEMKDLNRAQPLTYSIRKNLLLQFLLMNRYGYHPNSPIYLRNVDGVMHELTVKDLNETEVKALVQRCRSVIRDPDATTVDKNHAGLIFRAIMREAMWNITRKFPFSTQMLPILNSFVYKDSLLSEIDTGEGKGIIMAILSAALWTEADAVNACTSNLTLARVAFEEFSPVFDLVGIPHTANIITSQTSVTGYCYDGINYSDTAQLSLFIAKQKLDAYYIANCLNLTFSLALDEADFTFFDDSTHYRYAMPMHLTDINYVFPCLYKFIHSDIFKNESNTIGDDIALARELLLETATLKQKDSDYIAKLSDRQIDTWLDSALAADTLIEGKNFVVRTETRGTGEDTYLVSFARILANSRVSEGAEWSNGVHQFLHARLNVERETKQRRIPPFKIDPQTAPIASMNSRTVIEHHGRLLGVTGTAGSPAELTELLDQGIKSFRIPPHRPNQRNIEAPVIVYGEETHFSAILDSILRHLRQRNQWWFQLDDKPQPILVAMNDIEKSQRFYDYLVSEIESKRFRRYKHILHTQLLNGSTMIIDGAPVECSEDKFLSNGGVAGWITVSTLLDRGSDFKPRLNDDDAEQNHPDGLFALATFIASERLSRQIAGRAGRQGHPGQAQIVADQKEFDELLEPSLRNRGAEAIAMLQTERSLSAKEKRRFADRLAGVKNYFFSEYIKYIQDEKNITPDLNRMWASCLTNMDIEWNRLINKYRLDKNNKKNLLEVCTTGLILKACRDWNFMVPIGDKYILKPNVVENIILQKKAAVVASDAVDKFSSLSLGFNDVSAARYSLENSPLFMTMNPKNEEERAVIQNVLDKKRYSVALECIGQILDESIDEKCADASLGAAFTNMMTHVYTGNCIPYRKKLIEIFAIAEWSRDAHFTWKLSKIYLKQLYDFVMKKVSEFKGLNITIDRSDLETAVFSKEAVDIIALLNFLRVALQNKIDERDEKLAQMNRFEAVVDSTMTLMTEQAVRVFSLPDYLYAPVTELLKRLISMVDHPFTWDMTELTRVLKESRSSHVFLGSWCVSFSPDSEVDEEKDDMQDEMSVAPEIVGSWCTLFSAGKGDSEDKPLMLPRQDSGIGFTVVR